VKLATKALDSLRIQVMSSASRDLRNVLWGSRYLLLKNPENLEDSRDEKSRLDELLSLNKPLSIMYILKGSKTILGSTK
jgi:transposase